MKIKINANGHLEIERAGILKKQYCPHSPEGTNCGDWCPKFGESFQEGDHWCLEICDDHFWYGEIIDERKREDEK